MRFNDGGEQFVLWTRWSPRLAHCLTVLSLSRVQLFATPWTVALQSPLSTGMLQARILECVAMPFSTSNPTPGHTTGKKH